MNEEDKLKGQITSTESEMVALQTNHDRMVKHFNDQVASNQAQYHQLVGRLNTLREMLPKENGKNGKVDTVKPKGRRCQSALPTTR